MPVIIANTIYCPLCEKQMSKREVQIHAKRATAYFCRPCGIGIYDFDPAFNKWRDADKDIPCSTCGYPKIKWFARYMDGFFKGVCPKCKTTLKKDGDVRFGKGGSIIIPEDMDDDPVEPPVEIKIPLSHFIKKFGKDKVNALKAKFRSQKG
jgi:hypothetical protein